LGNAAARAIPSRSIAARGPVLVTILVTILFTGGSQPRWGSLNLQEPNAARCVRHLPDEGVWIVASRADEYRRHAQECLEIAPTFNNYQSRNILLQMSQVWLRLADNHEDAEMAGRAKVAAEVARPVVQRQQQQQIQPKKEGE
jgi:hypothetical protein